MVLPYDAHGTYNIPAVAGVSEEVPAHVVSRVAAWSLGDEPENTVTTTSVTFTS